MILVILAFLVGLAFWIPILQRWRRGIYLLLVYMPFAGVVTLSLYPSPLPTLFKDIFFVIPVYLSFFVLRRQNNPAVRIPQFIIGAMLVLASLVFIQMFNPGVANWMVAAIGAKVWLFYLPLFFLANAFLNSRDDLIKLLRLMVLVAWVPCTVGIAEWIGSMAFGHQAIMETIYGDAASQATQEFTSFDVGSDFYRIPSTFVFVTQYFGYTLAMVVPAYALATMDRSMAWRRVSTATLALVVIASFLSGARSAYLFVPLLMGLCYLIDGRPKGVIGAVVFLPILLLIALYIGDIDLVAMFEMMLELTTTYSDEIAYQGLIDAIQSAPFGVGTGMNTGPARYAFDDPLEFVAFENYYAKAVYELGILGLVVVVVLFSALVVYGYQSSRRIRDEGLRSCAAAILAFIVTMELNSFKGWQMDFDPINVYFWLFAGVLFKLEYLTPYLESQRDQPALYRGAA